MEDNLRRLKASLQLFDKLECCSSSMNGNFNDVTAALALVDLDKMRCYIINCLTALNLVETEKKIKDAVINNDNYEFVKSKVFNAAILMINSNEADVKTILSYFPLNSDDKISEERSWLPQHVAIALGMRFRISKDDIRIMLSVYPLPTHRLSEKETACLSIVCDKSGRCALHLVAEYSESLELLQDILRIDHKMTKMVIKSGEKTITSLGLLCSRRHFPAFDAMVSCLIEADSSVKVIYDGITNHIKSYDECLSQNISPGSKGAMSLILLGTLLDSNPAVTKFENSRLFSLACMYLRGELGVSVLSLFLTKDRKKVTAIGNGSLPIHVAADYSCVEVVKFLHKAWPESISKLDDEGSSLLHLAVMDDASDIADVTAKVQYICDQCPALIHLKNSRGNTPLHKILTHDDRFNLECVKILCNTDATVVRDKCPPSNITNWSVGQLPLHILIKCQSRMSEVSDEADCFRLLLRLYPAAAGIEDDRSRSPYSIAVSNDLSTYFVRLLLAADPTITPVQRCRLNFAARRQGMFLAYRALSSNNETTIWTKLRLKGRDLLQHVISYL